MSEYTVFHCGYLKKGKREMSDTPRIVAEVREVYAQEIMRLKKELTALRKDASSKWAFLEWRDRAEKAEAENAALHQCLRNVYEVWAGSEGIPAPTVASEAYLLSLVEQMRDAAKEGLK